MCKVIGKRPGLTPALETECDRLIGREIPESAWNFGLASLLPEGLVIESERYGGIITTNRRQLYRYEGQIITVRRDKPFVFTARDVSDWIHEAAKEYVAMQHRRLIG